jgi:CheY-like chemotaxis protein
MIQRRWKRVLVVDDEPTICELIAETLRESGYRVDTASNGAEALQVMCGRVPNVIVLDVMMPRLNAYGFVAPACDPWFCLDPDSDRHGLVWGV